MPNQEINKNTIHQIYRRLIAIELYLNKEYPHNVRKETADNYTKLLTKLKELIADDVEDFELPTNAFYNDTNNYCYLDLFLPKVIELKHFLEARFPFIKHGQLPIEVKLYLSVRDGLVDFLKSRLKK